MKLDKSTELFERAQKSIPGGVNSPVRAFRSVGGTPRFIASAKGCRVTDVDGNEYIDYVGSWGPLIFGHCDERITEAAIEALQRGSSFGAPTPLEVEMAELVRECFPTIDLVRMVNSGTEAVMSAVRVARAYTGKDKVIKFDGCWHGHADGLLVKAGSTGLQYGIPDSAGVPASYAEHTLVATYNDAESVADLIKANEGEVAAVVVEPVAGNMGVVPPKDGFLPALRDIADETGVVLIFDEVITGFRIALGGAQEYYEVEADMTTLGKIIGGGFPVGAYGGKREIMECISPLGPAVQAGTLSGNPVAMSAGIATLKALKEPGLYERLDAHATKLEAGIGAAAKEAGVDIVCNRVASMMTNFFTTTPVTCADDLSDCDADKYGKFFHAMLSRGVAFAPSYCEAAFVSNAHTDADIATTIELAEEAFGDV